MSYAVSIALNGTISDFQIPTKTKDILDFIRKKFKNNAIQFQGKLPDPSKETRMLSVLSSISEDDENVNSHMLPSPFDEEIYIGQIIIMASENDESDSFITNITSYTSIRSHEYETMYQEWTFAINDDEGIIAEDIEEEVEDIEEVFNEIEEDIPVVRTAPARIVKQVNSRHVFVDCAIREKVIENFTSIFTSHEMATEFEKYLLQNVVDMAKKEGYDIYWSNRTFWNMYRNRAISLYENLRGSESYVQNNENLISKLRNGDLTLKTLAEMTPIDLCPSRWKESIEKIIESEKKLYSTQKAASIFMWCSSCKKKAKCDYYQLQTRSADEPMTTFVTCLECNKKWKF